MNFKRFTVASALFIFVFYGGLIASLAYFLDGRVLWETLFSERTLFSIRLSVVAATLASLLALIIAVPASFALSRHSFPGRMVVDTILEFPIIVSPAALGAILLIFFNNPLGEWIQQNVMTFVFVFSGIVLAQFVTILGIATRLVKSTMDEIPASYEQVARSLGATPARAFATMTLPLARRGIISAFILSWAKAMGEFGATIMVAGTMAMRTETLPIAIYMRLATADIGGTVVLIVCLLLFGLGALYGVRLISSRLAKYA
ncbi:MAG: ABC transporter permease [Acidobacteria bacterium]|nr:ABC transporter permease [Acidobacteriota bacterium]